MMRAATVRVPTLEVQLRVARLFRRLVEDLGPAVSLSSIAVALDRSASIGPRWVKEDGAHPLPAFVLAARHAVPDALFDAFVEGLRSLRSQQPGGPSVVTVSPETAACVWTGRVGDALSLVGRALSDGRIAPDERAELRRAVAIVRSACDRLSESLGEERAS